MYLLTVNLVRCRNCQLVAYGVLFQSYSWAGRGIPLKCPCLLGSSTLGGQEVADTKAGGVTGSNTEYANNIVGDVSKTDSPK